MREDPSFGRRVYAIPYQRVWTEAMRLATSKSPRWVLLESDDESGVIRAEAATPVLRSVADVEIRVGLDPNAQTRVTMVSRSRTGRWDLGANARRTRRFFQALDRSLEKTAPSPPPSPPRTSSSLAEPSGKPDQS